MNQNTPALVEQVKNSPKQPGIYLMKNAAGKIIYVGKAKNLRNRLSSYFPIPQDVHPKTRDLCLEAAAIETTVTDNEAEALILEANLIRQNKPKYNIDLKETHRYAYVLITNEEYPRLLTVRKNRADQFNFQNAGLQGKIFGPFTEGSSRLNVIKTLRKAFGIRVCNKMPKKLCLKYHLKQCTGPCEQKISKEEYLQNVTQAVRVLNGKTAALEKELEKQMRAASQKLEYERALALKNRLHAIRTLSVRQKMELQGETGDEDYAAIALKGSTANAAIFKAIQGVVREREQYSFETIAGSEEEALSEFLPRYYAAHRIPQKIWVKALPSDASAICEFLEKTRGATASFDVPQSEDKKKLLSLVEKNAYLSLEQTAEPALLELKRVLRLIEIPRIMECFDASTLFGTNSVGSMVRFENGKPDKTNYRRFKIKFSEGTDDFSMMREIVYRRYYRIKMENNEMPNLVVVDGGKPQLSAAKQALDELGYSLQPVIGLAKQSEEIHSPERPMPLQLDRKNAGLQLLMRIRDEAHRFAITYHKKLRRAKAEKAA